MWACPTCRDTFCDGCPTPEELGYDLEDRDFDAELDEQYEALHQPMDGPYTRWDL